MAHTIRLRADATITDIYVALASTSARHVALVFPAGARVAVADQGELPAISSRCSALGMDASIVGGDELTRAASVAAGFVAATSLDDISEAEASAARSIRRARTTAPLPAVRPTLLLLEPDEREASGSRGQNEWHDNPPAYVRALLADSGVYSGPLDGDAIPGGHVTLRAQADDDGEGLAQASASYEDEITAMIRASSGVAPAEPVLPWSEDCSDHFGDSGIY